MSEEGSQPEWKEGVAFLIKVFAVSVFILCFIMSLPWTFELIAYNSRLAREFFRGL